MNMNKKIKKEYGKTGDKIMLRISTEERVVLTRMMLDDDWTNISGYIRHKLFGNSTESRYARMKKNVRKEDIAIMMQNLMSAMEKEMGYLNFRFNYELEQLQRNSDKLTDSVARKLVATMSSYKKAVLDRTSRICDDCEEILRHLDVKIDRSSAEGLEMIPDAIIEKALEDFDNTQTPEVMEGVRRSFEKYNKLLHERTRQRMIEEEQNNNKK